MTNNYLMVKDERRASFSRGILTDKSPLIWSYIINIKIILQRDKRSKLWPILEKPWTICKSLVLPKYVLLFISLSVMKIYYVLWTLQAGENSGFF